MKGKGWTDYSRRLNWCSGAELGEGVAEDARRPCGAHHRRKQNRSREGSTGQRWGSSQVIPSLSPPILPFIHWSIPLEDTQLQLAPPITGPRPRWTKASKSCFWIWARKCWKRPKPTKSPSKPVWNDPPLCATEIFWSWTTHNNRKRRNGAASQKVLSFVINSFLYSLFAIDQLGNGEFFFNIYSPFYTLSTLQTDFCIY